MSQSEKHREVEFLYVSDECHASREIRLWKEKPKYKNKGDAA